MRASATTNHSVRSGHTPPSSPNPCEGKYQLSAVEIVRSPTGVTKSGPITSGIPGKCVDIANSGSANGTAVQLYTGLVYHGPSLNKEILAGLAALLERDGFASVTDL